MSWLIRYSSFHLYFRKYFSEQVIIVKYFRGTIFDNVVSVVSVNNMFLVLSDVRIMIVSCGSMSKSCAATAQATPELPVSADAGPGSVDSSNTVDSNNISDTSELASLIHLIKIIDIVDDNVNDYYVVNQRVVDFALRQKLVVMRATRLVIRPPDTNSHCLGVCFDFSGVV